MPSDQVDPDSEVTREESEQVNQGNQGYVDDNQATPGSGSENNGINEETGFADSGIVAPGATTEGETRLPGGENQAANENGNAEMAGENAYHPASEIKQGQQRDGQGNAAQAEAQAESTPGGDNNSDAKEEARVAEGDF